MKIKLERDNYPLSYWRYRLNRQIYFSMCSKGLNDWFHLPHDLKEVEVEISKRPKNKNSLPVKYSDHRLYFQESDGYWCNSRVVGCVINFFKHNFQGVRYITLYYKD